MKNKVLSTILMILACSACFAGSLTFKSPILDTTVLPDSSTSSLLHFDGSLTDIAGNSWTGSPTYDAGKFGQAIKQVMPAGTTGYTQATLASAKTPFKAGSGAFTCEFWLGIDTEMLSYTTSQRLFAFDMQTTEPNTHEWAVYLSTIDPANNRYQLQLKASASGLYNISGFAGYITDTDDTQWYHICFERRAGGTLYLYLNGQPLGSGVMGVPLSGLSYVWLASYATPSASSTVYIDEFSFSKGIAKYQGAFTPSTLAYGNLKSNKLSIGAPYDLLDVIDDSNSIALMHLDGNFADLSSNTWTLTKDAYAPVSIATDSKFGTGSIYDSAGVSPDGWALTASDVASLQAIGTGDYTVEFWFKINDLYFNPSTIIHLFALRSALLNGTHTVGMHAYRGTDSTIYLLPYAYYYGKQAPVVAIPLTTDWLHIAAVKDSGVTSIYVNGVSAGSIAMNDNFATLTSANFGRDSITGVLGNWLADEIRISNVARYTSNFTPPAKPFCQTVSPRLGFKGSFVTVDALAWFDAADTSTISNTSGFVWTDKNSGYQLTQATPEVTPITGLITQNGKNILSFNYDYLDGNAALIPVGTTSYTIFVVGKATAGNQCLLHLGDTGMYRGVGLHTLTDNRLRHYLWGVDNDTPAGGFAMPNDTYAITAAYTDDPRKQLLRINGTEYSITPPASKDTATTYVRVGQIPGYGYSLIGTIGEIIIYHRALTTAEMQQIEAYLLTKWGL